MSRFATETKIFPAVGSDPYAAAVSRPDVNAYRATTGKPIGLVQVVTYTSAGPGFTASASGRYALVDPVVSPLIQELDLGTGRLVKVFLSGAAVPLAAAW